MIIIFKCPYCTHRAPNADRLYNHITASHPKSDVAVAWRKQINSAMSLAAQKEVAVIIKSLEKILSKK